MQGLWNLIGKVGQGPGKDFAFDIENKVLSPCDEKSLWGLHQGKKRITGDPVSIFVCDAKSVSPEEFYLAKTAYKRLKTLRHPNIIKFLDGFESETMLYMVTEPVTPLILFLDKDDGRNSNLITWGIHQITTGLSFLVNDCNLVHENVNIFSVFVGNDGEWKLSGMEYMHASSTDPVAKLPKLQCYNTPEGLKDVVKGSCSTDSWGLGCLIWEIYNGALQSPADLKIINKLPKQLVIHYCDLVCANPKSRSNPKKFLENCTKAGQFLDNDFIKANLFLQEIQIKDISEQKEFYSSLDKNLDSFPKQFCIDKILPQLLNAFEFSDSGSAILSPLFKVGLLLDEPSYQAKILPCIIKLFSSNDRATRVQLLQQLEKFIKHLQPNVVDNQIFACVATGFGDTLPVMREQTVKAMLLLAPKLSEKTVNNQLLKYFAKLQMDEQPGIRTNTTICLGKIAQYISESTRKKVLIPAFSRALRDPFPPARSAGVLALSATQEYYSIEDIAQKILPSICALTIDQEKNVRENAFKLIRCFLEKLEAFSKDSNSTVNNQEKEKEQLSQPSTWTGWAVTSLTSRFYQQQQQPQSPDSSTNSDSKPSAEINLKEHKTDVAKQEPNVSVNNQSVYTEAKNDDGGSNLKRNTKDDDSSDSDYGNWGEGDDWDFNDQKSKDKALFITKSEPTEIKKKIITSNIDEQSISNTVNMSKDISKKPVSNKLSPVQNNSPIEKEFGDSWEDTWGDLEDNFNAKANVCTKKDSSEKDLRKELAERRKQERNLQREQVNQEKRGKSAGALKLGAVKKVTDTSDINWVQ
ncbi:N-terminal kinase-like protein isoform X3 [Hydra vulgaris]|uniref:N-terminal kinase-like protein n=1 Tax=Hydra vulgaris TaxID=6087 RepID=A0ABM4CI18_HYDVU